MTRKLFSTRNLFLLPVIWTLAFSLSACGGTQATEPPSSEALTAIAPATEAPVDVNTATPQSTAEASRAVPAQPGIPETRRLTLEFPPKIKAGAESDIVRLTLEVDELGNITPTAVLEGNVVEGDIIEIPNLYESHNIMAEARFDIAGMEVQPPGNTFQPLKQGEPVTFHWSVRPQDVGQYRGTIWLHLVFTDRSSGEESRMAVSAQIVEIEAVDFFGFSTNFVRTSGVVGSVLGVIVGFPFFEDIVKYFLGRLGKKRRKSVKPTRRI